MQQTIALQCAVERLSDIVNDLAKHLLNSIDRPIDFRFLDNERWRQANCVPVGLLGQDF